MNQKEWMKSRDIIKMLNVLWENYPEKTLVPILHRFFLKCARNIEILLPHEKSDRALTSRECPYMACIYGLLNVNVP